VHEPPAQVPDEAQPRRVALSRQYAAGGVEQVTPAHGSLLQAPLVQPYIQVVSCTV